MWRISIRYRGELEWESIWFGDGALAEHDARAHFSRVSDWIDGDQTGPRNANIADWVAARLEGPGLAAAIEHAMKMSSTVPPPR
jgi:hypothetical protein